MFDGDFSTRKIIVLSVAANAVLLLVLGGIIFLNQGRIFSYFGKSYLDELNRSSEDGKTNMPAPLTQDAQVTAAVRAANPAVVSIIISKDIPIIEQYYENVNPFPGFEDFFGGGFNFQIPQYRQKGTERKQVGGGSGFIVSADGLVVTNNHVVSDASASYTLFTNDGKKHAVLIIAKDSTLDIAVLKIKEAGSYPFLSFGDSDNLNLGQTVIAIGNALGEFRNSVSVGVISGLSRSIVAGDGSGQSELLDEVIQTDAAINPGNSGGPLLDIRGKIVGVNVAMVAGSENVGFALPGNVVRAAVNSVIKNGKIVRPYVGIRYVAVTESIKDKNKLTVDYGILISRGEEASEEAVIAGSPAEKAGLKEGDVIVSVDGERLDENKSFSQIIRKKNVGDTIVLKIIRQGTSKEIRATLDKFPEK